MCPSVLPGLQAAFPRFEALCFPFDSGGRHRRSFSGRFALSCVHVLSHSFSRFGLGGFFWAVRVAVILGHVRRQTKGLVVGVVRRRLRVPGGINLAGRRAGQAMAPRKRARWACSAPSQVRPKRT